MTATETAIRDVCFVLARLLDEHAPPPGLTWDTPPPPSANGTPGEGRNWPGDDFNRRATWEEILAPHGWEAISRRGDVVFWRRPGKEEHAHSATTGHCKNELGQDLLYVFSTSVPSLTPDRSYSRFAAYTLLNHAGDYKAAARALAGKGYGDQRQRANASPNGHAAASQAAAPVAHAPEVELPEPPPWPEPPAAAAYHGLAGDIVRAIEPQTEADPVAILIQILVMFGNVIGRGAYWMTDDTKHHGNLFCCLVGETAIGKKGTARARAVRAFDGLDDDGWRKRIMSGLSTGEGLIRAVKDTTYKTHHVKKKGRVIDSQEIVDEQGEADKRLMVVESEFGRTLRAMAREGNTLSAVMRQAWDGEDLGVLTAAKVRATGAHISAILHITPAELRRLFPEVETDNGFGNRLLWVASRYSKLLPLGGRPVDLRHFRDRIREAVQEGKHHRECPFEPDAAEFWHDEIYPRLFHRPPGIMGSITQRAVPQVRRLAMLYAVLDVSLAVSTPHLLAALALWNYCERSARWVFGDSTGDSLADEIKAVLLAAGTIGVTQTELSRQFGRHKTAVELGRALAVLLTSKLARKEVTQTGGCPSTRYFSVS